MILGWELDFIVIFSVVIFMTLQLARIIGA